MAIPWELCPFRVRAAAQGFRGEPARRHVRLGGERLPQARGSFGAGVGRSPGGGTRRRDSGRGTAECRGVHLRTHRGSAGGVVPAPEGYAEAVHAVCRKYDVLVIADEVMCGAGRTGSWRALEHDRVVPDIMSIAKGLAEATSRSERRWSARESPRHSRRARRLYDRPHFFRTYRGVRGGARRAADPRARPPARARTNRRRGAARHAPPGVGQIRRSRRRARRGYFIGIELVADPVTKAPFPADRALSFDIGRAPSPTGSFAIPAQEMSMDGGRHHHHRPPYNASDEELEEIVVRLGRAVEAALSSR